MAHITAIEAKTQRSHKNGFVQKLARKLVLQGLHHLEVGQLIIDERFEGGEKFTFGERTGGESQLVANMRILDPSVYVDVMLSGSIGAAEAYMTRDWETDDLTAVVRLLVRNMTVLDEMEGGLATLSKPIRGAMHWFNKNSEKGSRRNIAAHYDLSNDFFELFLDPTMMYSSGIFPHENASMEEASLYKLQRICEKLELKSTDHLVEIGSGWGGMAIYAARHYGCKVTTITISEQQFNLAQERIKAEGLEHLIDIRIEDYRQLEGQYDKLVSIEMIEAVGWQFYETYFDACSRLLKPEGLMLVQAITIADQRYDQARRNVDFIQKYIFPGSCIPSITALQNAATEASDLTLVNLEDITPHYAKTLNAWCEAFMGQLDQVKRLGFSEEFIRMWEFYLCYCEGGFTERAIGDVHLLFKKPLNRSDFARLPA